MGIQINHPAALSPAGTAAPPSLLGLLELDGSQGGNPDPAQVPEVTLRSPEVPPGCSSVAGVSHGNRNCATRETCLDGARAPLCYHSSGGAECSMPREGVQEPFFSHSV